MGGAFAALKESGEVVTWGHTEHGGDSSSVADKLAAGALAIYNTNFAVAALKAGGEVVTWGARDYGGDSSRVAHKLCVGVDSVCSTGSSFAALKWCS